MGNWKEIPNTNGIYLANKNGQIKSIARIVIRGGKNGNYVTKDKILKPIPMKIGYVSVGLYISMIWTPKYIHRIIAETFIPNPNNLPYVCHRNDIKTDNRVENLFWGTQKDNMQDKLDKGGETGRKLNIEQLTEVKEQLKSKISQRKIAKEFNVTQACINYINTGKSYKTHNSILV